MTRKQLKYFGTKRQKAAAKAAAKRGRKKAAKVGGTKKRKSGKRKNSRAVTGIATPKKRRNGVRGPMKNITKSLIPSGAAFAGGYVSGMIEEKLTMVKDPDNRPLATAAIGLLAVMFSPAGPVGAFGLGVIGGAGRGMQANSDSATDDAGDGVTTAGVGRNGGRRARVQAFRRAMKTRVNGASTRNVVAGVPDDRTVITGPGQPGARYNRV